jgi:hypothetical protein
MMDKSSSVSFFSPSLPNFCIWYFVIFSIDSNAEARLYIYIYIYGYLIFGLCFEDFPYFCAVSQVFDSLHKSEPTSFEYQCIGLCSMV